MLKKNLLSTALLGFSIQLALAQIPKTMQRLPDTGQTQSYTTTPGEDADFDINLPFFILNGDGTTTDSVTGLMWQQMDGGEMTFENAVVFCENLTLGGYNDWRLPTTQEAYSILNQGKSNPALDITAFSNSVAEYWWTSQKDATNANKIWVTNKGGGIGNHLKNETVSAGGTKKIHVRAVRDRSTPPTVPSHFSDNNDGSITDNLTNLVWQKTPAPDSMTWENALVYAQNLSIGGQNDWRVPNIKELQSLSDVSMANPAVSTAIFPNIGIKKYWASTSLPNQITRAWYLDTRFGITTYELKTGKFNLICVRGPINSTTKTNDLSEEKTMVQVFPNPFSDHILLKNAPKNASFEMINAAGLLVFSGNNIEKQDFTTLRPGIYCLKIISNQCTTFKLVKY
jgi:Protein of unknown function (DUF1566)